MNLPFQAPSPPPTVPLDSGTQGLLSQSVQNAQNSTPQSVANETFGNAGKVGGSILQTEGQTDQNAASTGQDPSMLNAIRRAYSAKAGQGIARVKSQEDMNAYRQNFNRTRQVLQSALGEQQAITNQNPFLTNAYMQQEQARAQMIGSIFQTIDTGIGIAAGRSSKRSNGGGRVGGYDSPSSYDLGESPGIDNSGAVTSPGIY
jgi:hypothetical protein